MTLDSIRICWFVGDNYACGTKPAITGYLSFPFFFFLFLSFFPSFFLSLLEEKGKRGQGDAFPVSPEECHRATINESADKGVGRVTHEFRVSIFLRVLPLKRGNWRFILHVAEFFHLFFLSFLFFSFVREKVRLEEFVFVFFVLKEKNNLTLLRIVLFNRC